MCGVALAMGTLLVAWILIASASGPEHYDFAMSLLSHPLGQLVLFGWSVALFYHLSNGIRHLIWDTGRLFKIEDAYKAGYVVLASTAILTAAVWYCAKNYSPAAQFSPYANETLAEFEGGYSE
jgi:succinate dehydrogenase / fumarate reductase cytochrome b subunit